MEFGNPILSGTTLIRDAIKSEGYVPGVSGWSINRDGTAEFQDIVARGDIFATGLDVDVNGEHIEITSAFSSPAIRWQYPLTPEVSSQGGYILGALLGFTSTTLRHEIEMRPKAIVPLSGVGFKGTPTFRLASETRDGLLSGTGVLGPPTAHLEAFASDLGYAQFHIGRQGVPFFIHAPDMRAIEGENFTTDTIASTTFVPGANSVGFTFVAPTSGIVRVDRYAGLLMTLSANVSRSVYGSWEMREGATIGSGTIVEAAADNNGVYCRVGATTGMEEATRGTAHKHKSGLTPGATYNIRTMHRVASATTGGTFQEFARRLTVTPSV
jgi:hypothetical protein